MTQTKSCSNKKIFLSLYKNALKRISATSVLYLIICFAIFPVSYITEASNIKKTYANYETFPGLHDIYPVVSILFYFVVIIGGAIILSVLANNFMHNKKAVDVFHALPVKRHQQLLANFFAVITTLLISQAICYGVVAIAAKLYFEMSFAPIFAEFIRIAVITVIIVAISFLSCVCCATSLDSTIFSAAFLAIVPAYTGLITILYMFYTDGYIPDMQILYTAFKFSPAVMMYQVFLNDSGFEYSVSLSIIYVIAAIAIMALSCFIYKMRKSEMAQSTTSKNILYKFMTIAASVGTGIMLGLSYQSFTVFDVNTVKDIIIPSLLFTIVVYLVFNAIISRNAKPNKTALINLGVSIVLVVAGIFVADNRFNAINMYVPKAENIKTVKLELDSQYSNILKAMLDKNGNIIMKGNRSDNTVFEDEKTINLIVDIHQLIVNEKNSIENDYFNESFGIEYILENGKTVKRGYNKIPKSAINTWLELVYSEEFKTKLYPVISEPTDKVLNFEIKDGFAKNYQTLNLNDEQRNMLYNAIAQDTLNMTSQMKTQQKGIIYARISINYKNIEEKPKLENNKPQNQLVEMPEYTDVVFNVTDASINTINALKQIGLEQYTQINIPEDVSVIVAPNCEYYNSVIVEEDYSSSFDTYPDMYDLDPVNSKRYEDVDKLKQLAETSSTIMYMPSEENRYFSVYFVPKDFVFNGEEYNPKNIMAYYLSYKDVPDFIKQDFTEMMP